jgi:hypothetical protein
VELSPLLRRLGWQIRGEKFAQDEGTFLPLPQRVLVVFFLLFRGVGNLYG